MRLLDYFCGAGFASLGFKDAGFEVDTGYDHWPVAIKTYRKYIGPGKLVELADYNPTKKDYDAVVFGSPPCTDFSRANRQRNIFSKTSSLVLDFCRIVEAIQPEVFVFENVIHLAKWAEVAVCEISGYKTTKNIVDAKYYGVPQSRRRKFFIGNRKRFVKAAIPPDHKILTVRDTFSKIENNWGFTAHRPSTVEKFKKVKKRRWVNTDNGEYSSTIRLQWDQPSCSIVNVKKFQILHPEEDRSISIAEAAALQGIPPWYIPEGSDMDKALQIANAVPPKLAQYIATLILSTQANSIRSDLRFYG